MKHVIRTIVLALIAGLAIFALAVGCSSEPAGVTLTSIGVAPTGVSFAKGTTQKYTATGTYSDSTTKDLTTSVTWTSSDEKVVTISNEAATKGLATGVAKGTATITATITDSGTSVHGGTSVTITDVPLKSIALAPASLKLAKGTMAMVVATGTFDDGTTQDLTESADWTSSAAAVATVSSAPGSKGTVTGVAEGTATITAAVGDVKATLATEVTMATLQGIGVTSPEPWIAKGMKEQFSAYGVFSDGTLQDLTQQVLWASTEPAVTISNDKGSKGLASAVSEGTTIISATLMGVTGSTPFSVTSATVTTVSVTPTNPTIAKGTVQRFMATGILSDGSFRDLTEFATWKSANEAVATVSNDPGSKGNASGVAAGLASISATFQGKTGSSDLSVTSATLTKVDLTPLNPTIAKGTMIKFAAIGTFSDKSAQDLSLMATWGSSDPTVAWVSNMVLSRGMATALAQGVTTISASINGLSDATVLTVSPATLSSITITPPNPVIAKGSWIGLTATGTYSDATTQDLTYVATWKSSNGNVYVDDWLWHKGSAYGVSQGVSEVSASFGGKTGMTTVGVSSAVLDAIAVTPANGTIAKGTTLQFTATGIYTDNTTQDLTEVVAWSTSDASVAVSNAIGSHGLATGVVVGQATVSAKIGDKVGTATLSVSAATLVSIGVTPLNASIAKGTSLQFTATGTYTDNSKQDLTKEVSWASSSPAVSISNLAPFIGLAQGISEGMATITASLGGKSGETTLNITAATLATLTIAPAEATIAKGTVQWYKVTGKYTDDSTQDLTDFVAYSSSDPTKVIISNAAGSRGLATAVAEGQVTITAATQGKLATAILHVSAATLATIDVTPLAPSMGIGATLQFVATGTYTDNTKQVITNLVTWVSSNQEVAIISNAGGSRGLATSVKAGTTTITAFGAGKNGSTLLTVNP
ncbi:MAG: Ig-like domain-containing protein [Byssovorax sp.]